MVFDRSNGSNRGDKPKVGLADNWKVLSVIGVALVMAALMLLLLQPKDPKLPLYKPDDAKTAGYQADATNCSPEALAAIGDVRKRAAQRNDCADKAEDHRLKADDLIQQTGAADAARAQAVSAGYQSWLALWATVGGFLTLIAAGLAAAYARDAAREGKRSADAARDAVDETSKANDSYKAQQRGRLRFWQQQITTLGGAKYLPFKIENTGHTECILIEIHYTIADHPVWLQPTSCADIRSVIPSKMEEVIEDVNSDILTGHDAGYILGLIVYDGIAGMQYSAYFCYRFWRIGESDVGFEWADCEGLPRDT